MLYSLTKVTTNFVNTIPFRRTNTSKLLEMARIKRQKFDNGTIKMTNKKKYFKERSNEKRYISPHIFCMKWEAFWKAHNFRNMKGDWLPRFPQHDVPNYYLKGVDLYNALVAEGIAVKWEDEDRSPSEFHHGPYTDGIGRKVECLYGENLHKVSEEMLNDPDRPELRGSHDLEDHRAHLAYIRRTPRDALPEIGERDQDTSSDEEANYPGAVKKAPALRKMKRRKAAHKRVNAEMPRPQNLEAPARQKGETLGAAKNALRLAEGKSARGRPKKDKSDLGLVKQDTAREMAQGVMGEATGAEKAVAPPKTPSLKTGQIKNGAASSARRRGEIAGETLRAATLEDGKVGGPLAKPKFTPGGFERNLQREKEGMRKRGRPLGVKNKPKPALQGAKQDSAPVEASGGIAQGALKESGNRENDGAVVPKTPTEHTDPK